jgi:hypothetical protein
MQACKPPPKPTQRQKPTTQRKRTTNERASCVQQLIRFASDGDWAVSTTSVCAEIGQRILDGALELSLPIAISGVKNAVEDGPIARDAADALDRVYQ